MTNEEPQQREDDTHHERWMAQYGFVLPTDPEHPVTKKFWELEMAHYEWREAFILRRYQTTDAMWDSLLTEIVPSDVR
ncbi:hypothetical protein WK91_34565 [Burkholderia cepacia]|uniref:hypothetical protein n=1 Tax=Burkholderia cepacia TaxID=292 RepID=UPI000758430A|nr:hypothetical protein [Burkholderia cepacia]KVW05815.1 hypothetical protein WK91_34565 [Burkholderia cepacia]